MEFVYIAVGFVGVVALAFYWFKVRSMSASRHASIDAELRPSAQNETTMGELQEDRRALEAAVMLARDVARAVDADEVRQMLERTLRQWWPSGRWVVISPQKLEEDSDLPEDAALRLAISKSTPTASEGSGTIIARHLEAAANKAIFTLRDPTALYAVVLAKRDAIDETTAARAEIFLRVAVSALRSTSLLDSLLMSERLAAVGRLAAGVAHEINNPLAFVLMNLRVVEHELRGMQVGENLDEAIADAQDGADRIAQIVQGMKLLSHTEELNIEQLELRSLAQRTAKIARARNLTIPVEVDDSEDNRSVWTVADEVRIGQIMLNLMTNALDAAQTNPSPRVSVQITSDKNLAIVDVTDNGSGIPCSLQDRLFSAGVTTKGKRGSGLGLRISRSFARAHRGDIVLVRTGPGGTVFRLTLPVSKDRAKPSQPILEPITPAPSHKPRILIVDDESAVVRALVRWLSTKADVDGTSDPYEGLDLAEKHRYSLILCDLNMPKMIGTEFIETLKGSSLRGAKNARRAVIMTGSIDEQIPGVEVISKPLDVKAITGLLECPLPSDPGFQSNAALAS